MLVKLLINSSVPHVSFREKWRLERAGHHIMPISTAGIKHQNNEKKAR